jgi:hypothetical protein
MQRSTAARRRPPPPRRGPRRDAPGGRASLLAAGLLLVTGLLLVATAGACGGEEPDAVASAAPSSGGTAGESGGTEPSLGPTTAPAAVTEERLMRERVRLLQGYIETFALEHYFVYPEAADVRESGALPAPQWPADPWTGEDMHPGTSPGSYTYTVATDRRSYRLVGHLPAGEIEVRGSMPYTALTAYRHREQEGLSLIRQYVIEWARRHGGLYPPASAVSREGGVGALRNGAMWPSNPWNHGPMIQSDAVGDFDYEVAADRSSCSLTLHTSPTSDWTLDCRPLDTGEVSPAE